MRRSNTRKGVKFQHLLHAFAKSKDIVKIQYRNLLNLENLTNYSILFVYPIKNKRDKIIDNYFLKAMSIASVLCVSRGNKY